MNRPENMNNRWIFRYYNFDDTYPYPNLSFFEKMQYSYVIYIDRKANPESSQFFITFPLINNINAEFGGSKPVGDSKKGSDQDKK